MTEYTFQKWGEIIDDVGVSYIPVSFVKKVVIKYGKSDHVIKVKRLMNRGASSDDIEDMVHRAMKNLRQYDPQMMFVLDIKSVCTTVQPLTDIVLKKLKKSVD